MSELVPGGVAGFFAFGYLGYLWTYSIMWPLGVLLAIYVVSISFTLQSFRVFDVYIVLPVAAELGVLLAVLIANASLLPPLVPRLAHLVSWSIVSPERDNDDDSFDDSDIEGGMRVETHYRQASTITGAILLTNGALTLAGVFGDNLTMAEQLVYGIPQVILGLALLAYGFVALFTSAKRADRADARYIGYLYLFAALPPLVYGLSRLIVSPFEIVPLWIVLFVLTALVVVAEIGALGVRAEQPLVPLESDPRYARAERYPVRIIQRWVLVTALPLLVVYTTCWAVETFVGDDATTGDSLGAAAVVTAIMALVTAFFGGFSSPRRANGYFGRDEAPVTTVTVVSEARPTASAIEHGQANNNASRRRRHEMQPQVRVIAAPQVPTHSTARTAAPPPGRRRIGVDLAPARGR